MGAHHLRVASHTNSGPPVAHRVEDEISARSELDELSSGPMPERFPNDPPEGHLQLLGRSRGHSVSLCDAKQQCQLRCSRLPIIFTELDELCPGPIPAWFPNDPGSRGYSVSLRPLAYVSAALLQIGNTLPHILLEEGEERRGVGGGGGRTA